MASIQESHNVHSTGFTQTLPLTEKLPGSINITTLWEIGPIAIPDGRTLNFRYENHPDNTGGDFNYEDNRYSDGNSLVSIGSSSEKMEALIKITGYNTVSFISLPVKSGCYARLDE